MIYNVDVNIYDGFVFYSGLHQVAMGLFTRGIADENLDAVFVPDAITTKHEMLAYSFLKHSGMKEGEHECRDPNCFASHALEKIEKPPICSKHKNLIKKNLDGVNLDLNCSVYCNYYRFSDIEEEIKENVEEFQKQTEISVQIKNIKRYKNNTKDGDWLLFLPDSYAIVSPIPEKLFEPPETFQDKEVESAYRLFSIRPLKSVREYVEHCKKHLEGAKNFSNKFIFTGIFRSLKKEKLTLEEIEKALKIPREELIFDLDGLEHSGFLISDENNNEYTLVDKHGFFSKTYDIFIKELPLNPSEYEIEKAMKNAFKTTLKPLFPNVDVEKYFKEHPKK